MELTTVPSPVLAKKSRRVTAAALKAGEYADLFARMKEAMVKHEGIGLAAPQVGRDLAIFVIDGKLASQNDVPSAYADPEITEYGRETEDLEEGCLSIPGLWTPITRSKKVMFKALDEHGNKVKFRARGLLARVLQHETDHLHGTTIKERADKKSSS